MNAIRPVSLVTGGGRRLGRSIALALAEAGHDVVVHYHRSADAAAGTTAEAEGFGARAVAIGADLSSPPAVKQLVEAAYEALGHLDHVVSSASSLQKRKTLKVSADDWDAAMATNLRGPFLLAQAAARKMPAPAPGGPPSSITFVADGSGLWPWPDYAAHGTARAGLLYLTRSLAMELAPRVRVNAIVAGPLLVPDDMDPDGPVWRRILESVPLGRSGSADDLTSAVRFLIQSAYITGAVLPVDGGQHLSGRGG